jgi:hypothetical protein
MWKHVLSAFMLFGHFSICWLFSPACTHSFSFASRRRRRRRRRRCSSKKNVDMIHVAVLQPEMIFGYIFEFFVTDLDISSIL